jgi:hypothetical protein
MLYKLFSKIYVVSRHDIKSHVDIGGSQVVASSRDDFHACASGRPKPAKHTHTEPRAPYTAWDAALERDQEEEEKREYERLRHNQA